MPVALMKQKCIFSAVCVNCAYAETHGIVQKRVCASNINAVVQYHETLLLT